MNKKNEPKKEQVTYGFMGKILWIDLTEGKITEEVIPDEYYEKFLSGYGLAAKVIFDHQKPGVNPLGPDNIFGMMSGMLTGTGTFISGRWIVVGKSPLTGTWGDSNCGGHFAPEIKKTGYDGFFFTGKSPDPVYLFIDGDKRELKSASELWGKDTTYTDDYLRDTHGKDFRVACIGQAGETLSLMAGVVTDKGRLAARSGLGAVMGSKNLKAVCIRGNTNINVYDKQVVSQYSRKYLEDVTKNAHVKNYKEYGTAAFVNTLTYIGESPVKNWKGSGAIDFPESLSEKISDESVIKYETKKYGCYSCPIVCGGKMAVKDGPYPLKEAHKPEYETLCGFGGSLLCDDARYIIKINDMLNRAGIDTISCAGVVSWAFEAYEEGVLTREDTGGLELVWGNKEAAVNLVQKIIDEEGIGIHLKDGVKRASEYFDSITKNHSVSYAINAGGQGLPMHDPRRPKHQNLGLGVAYEAEPTPGRHTSTLDVCDKYRKKDQKEADPHSFGRAYADVHQGDELRDASCMMDLINGLGLCYFGFTAGLTPPVVEWINGVTGWKKDFEAYLEIGRRIKTLRHSFNIREGINPEDTLMTNRAKGIPPLEKGPNAGSSPDIATAKKNYYKAMGYDPDTAIPLKETLEELELVDVIKALYP